MPTGGGYSSDIGNIELSFLYSTAYRWRLFERYIGHIELYIGYIVWIFGAIFYYGGHHFRNILRAIRIFIFWELHHWSLERDYYRKYSVLWKDRCGTYSLGASYLFYLFLISILSSCFGLSFHKKKAMFALLERSSYFCADQLGR